MEITIEVNPGTVCLSTFQAYQEIGINRISIGAQSFNKNQLKSIGRIHDNVDIEKSIVFLKKINFLNFNIDLMYGLPNQTLQDSLNDLIKAVQLKPTHISWYQLTVEKNTQFYSFTPTLPSEDNIWKIFKKGHNFLISQKYLQYEISSYAAVNHFCKHNMNYWNFGDYLGIGCGSHSKITNNNKSIIRIIKTSSPKKFMEGTYIFKTYKVKNKDKPFEFFLNRFRLLKDIPRETFEIYTGLKENYIRLQINQAIDNKYIKESKKNWILTRKGKRYLNNLLEIFIDI